MNHKAAAPVEVSENPPPDADVLEERAVNAGNAATDGVHQDVALHTGQDLFHARGRLVEGIGAELQFYQRLASPAHALRTLFFSGVLIQKGVGQRAHDAQSALGALALLLALLSQFVRMVDETFYARLLRPALFGSQRLAVVCDHQAGSRLFGLDVEFCRGSPGRSFGAAK